METKKRVISIIITIFIVSVFYLSAFYFIDYIHDFEIHKVVEPTVKEYGYTLRICKHCGMVKKDNYVEPTSYLMPNIVINEVCSINNNMMPDENGDCFDWVELYNPTNRNINLKGFGLSDKKTDLFQYTFGDVEIKANDYLVVYAVGDEVVESSDIDKIYANFKLSSEGESIYITIPNRKIADKISCPQLKDNESYARFAVDNSVSYKTTKGTPMKKNKEFVDVEAPAFSVNSGFYINSFDLNLTAEIGTEIYYTLDSTEPNMNSIKYEGPIRINNATANDNVYRVKNDTTIYKEVFPKEKVDKATIIRAIAYDKDWNSSDIVTNSYFVGLDNYKNKNVISLVTKPDNLFSDEEGIYVKGASYKQWESEGKIGEGPTPNWRNRGFLWERPAEVTCFYNENLVFEQILGIRVRGAGSRNWQRKSFNVYARKFYDGQNRLLTPLFNEIFYQKSFILRACDYKEGFLQSLVADCDISTQLAKPCSLFIDGEYWGEYQILEKYATHYIEEHFGIDKDNVSMIKAGQIDSGNQICLNDYNVLLSYIRNSDMSIKENYNYVCECVDIQSLIDLYCTQIYLNNVDFSYSKNVEIWRSETKSSNPYEDGKWRWMLYDMDECIKSNWSDIKTFYDFNTFTEDFPCVNGIYEDPFITSLMNNEDFRMRFVNTFMDMANSNFNKDVVKEKLYKVTDKPGSSIITFFENRFDYITSYMADFFKLKGKLTNVTLNINYPEQGSIKLNSLPMINNKWNGKYYTDYEMNVEAIAQEGYSFIGWKIEGAEILGDRHSEKVSVKLIDNKDCSIEAVFEKDKI